jgi:hypothetical protein
VAASATAARARSRMNLIDRPSLTSVISARCQCEGRHGMKLSSLAPSRNPKIDSTAARCSQAAAPVYQLHPPRPTYGGWLYTSPAITYGSSP